MAKLSAHSSPNVCSVVTASPCICSSCGRDIPFATNDEFRARDVRISYDMCIGRLEFARLSRSIVMPASVMCCARLVNHHVCRSSLGSASRSMTVNEYGPCRHG